MLAASPEKSTSHNAIMFSLPFTEAFKISLPPFPPEAMAAIFNLSLGEMKPEPPNTCLGTIKIEAVSYTHLTLPTILLV